MEEFLLLWKVKMMHSKGARATHALRQHMFMIGFESRRKCFENFSPANLPAHSLSVCMDLFNFMGDGIVGRKQVECISRKV